MELINNFSEIFLSVWNKGILGVDILQILIGLGIFLIFLVFRGLISKLIIKKLKIYLFQLKFEKYQHQVFLYSKQIKIFQKNYLLIPYLNFI